MPILHFLTVLLPSGGRHRQHKTVMVSFSSIGMAWRGNIGVSARKPIYLCFHGTILIVKLLAVVLCVLSNADMTTHCEPNGVWPLHFADKISHQSILAASAIQTRRLLPATALLHNAPIKSAEVRQPLAHTNIVRLALLSFYSLCEISISLHHFARKRWRYRGIYSPHLKLRASRRYFVLYLFRACCDIVERREQSKKRENLFKSCKEKSELLLNVI